MTLLGGGAAALFGELLTGLYASATLHATVDTYDEGGNLTREKTALDCRVQIDRATERMVQAEGYTAGDVAVIVLAAPTPPLPPIDALDTGAEILVLDGPYAGQRFKVGSPIDRDPAAAGWIARGSKVEAG